MEGGGLCRRNTTVCVPLLCVHVRAGGPGAGAGAMEVSSDHELPNNANSGLLQPQAQPGGGFGSFLQ
eukprot:scaffold309657_cov23-Tisochrysis_lutea.AAC.2